MFQVGSNSGVPIVLMHHRGNPLTMNRLVDYDDVVASVQGFLADRIDAAARNAIPRWGLIVDPGVGFAKKTPENIEVLQRLDEIVHDRVGGKRVLWFLGRVNCSVVHVFSCIDGGLKQKSWCRQRSWGVISNKRSHGLFFPADRIHISRSSRMYQALERYISTSFGVKTADKNPVNIFTPPLENFLFKLFIYFYIKFPLILLFLFRTWLFSSYKIQKYETETSWDQHARRSVPEDLLGTFDGCGPTSIVSCGCGWPARRARFQHCSSFDSLCRRRGEHSQSTQCRCCSPEYRGCSRDMAQGVVEEGHVLFVPSVSSIAFSSCSSLLDGRGCIFG